jgi:hypothetical protein
VTREATPEEYRRIQQEALADLIGIHIEHFEHLQRRAAQRLGVTLPGQARRNAMQKAARLAAQQARPGPSPLRVAS